MCVLICRDKPILIYIKLAISTYKKFKVEDIWSISQRTKRAAEKPGNNNLLMISIHLCKQLIFILVPLHYNEKNTFSIVMSTHSYNSLGPPWKLKDFLNHPGGVPHVWAAISHHMTHFFPPHCPTTWNNVYKYKCSLTPGMGGVLSPSGPCGKHSWGDMVGDSSI